MKKNDMKSANDNAPSGIKELLKKATTEMMVLFILRQKPMYTYEMMNEIEYISDGVLTFNTLYQAIYRLRNNGYIEESSKVLSDDNRIRVYFSITHIGLIYLEKLITEYRKVTGTINKILDQDTIDVKNKSEEYDDR